MTKLEMMHILQAVKHRCATGLAHTPKVAISANERGN